MMAQIQENKWKTVQLTTDYKGDNYTASLTMGNPDPLSGTGMGIAHYLQNVTKNLALGTELAYQAAPQIPGRFGAGLEVICFSIMSFHFRRPYRSIISAREIHRLRLHLLLLCLQLRGSARLLLPEM